MRVAATVWNGRVSPVFDTARLVHIAEVGAGESVNPRDELLPEGAPQQRVARLHELGIEVLVCGAISNLYADLIESSGIRLVPFVSGEVGEVMQMLTADGLQNTAFSMPGCGCRRQGRRRQQGRGRQCGGFGPRNG